MAHGYVKPYRIVTRRGGNSWSWRRHSTVRFRAWVESQGKVVWRDDGWKDLSRAVDTCYLIALAFTVTDAKGQHHISWDDVVDEVEAD